MTPIAALIGLIWLLAILTAIGTVSVVTVVLIERVVYRSRGWRFDAASNAVTQPLPIVNSATAPLPVITDAALHTDAS